MKAIISILLILLSLSAFSERYYISNTGNDSWSGTSRDSSWTSLSKVNSTTFSAGDQVLFNRGDSWVGTLTITDSGTSTNPIIYGAYGIGSNPRIYGSELITGWAVYSGDIDSATYSTSVTQFFLDDERMKVARYPDSNYFPITTVESSAVFTSDTLSAVIDYTDAVWLGRTNHWAIENISVTSSSGNEITLNTAPSFGLGVDEGFVLVGKLEFLNQAGEWYYDESSSTVYLWTPNGDSPSNYTVRGSTYESCITVEADHVQIYNFDLRQPQNYGVEISNSNYITVDNCNIYYPEIRGIIESSSSSSYITASNNFVIGANSVGIGLSASNSTISHNQIYDSSLFYNLGLKGRTGKSSGWGIATFGGNSNVKYNRVIRCGDDAFCFAYSNNLFEYNYVDSCSLVTDDGGAFYGWGSGVSATDGTIIRYNIVTNAIGNIDGLPSGTGYQAFGIYCDDDNSNWIVTGNSFYNIVTAAITFTGSNHSFTNNTMLGSFFGLSSGKLTKLNCSYTNNTVASDSYWSPMVREILIALDSFPFTYDNNIYISPYRTEVFSRGVGWSANYSYTFSEWKELSGQDANSTIILTELEVDQEQRLLYNATSANKSMYLGDGTYLDGITGDTITSLTLSKFTSRLVRFIATD